MSFRKPYLASSSDRTVLAKVNQRTIAPEMCFDTECLRQNGLIPITFDFFVNWDRARLGQDCIGNQIWAKLLMSSEMRTLIMQSSARDVPSLVYGLIKYDGVIEHLTELERFCKKYGFDLRIELIEDLTKEEWLTNADARVIELTDLLSGQMAPTYKSMSFDQIKQHIRHTRGSKGLEKRTQDWKGLTFATSGLESALSLDVDLWPGDADILLVSPDGTARHIIELKKITKASSLPIEQECIRDRYLGNPRKRIVSDKKKYESLVAIAKRLGNIPLTVFFFEAFCDDSSRKYRLQSARYCQGVDLSCTDGTYYCCGDLPLLNNIHQLDSFSRAFINYHGMFQPSIPIEYTGDEHSGKRMHGTVQSIHRGRSTYYAFVTGLDGAEYTINETEFAKTKNASHLIVPNARITFTVIGKRGKYVLVADVAGE